MSDFVDVSFEFIKKLLKEASIKVHNANVVGDAADTGPMSIPMAKGQRLFSDSKTDMHYIYTCCYYSLPMRTMQAQMPRTMPKPTNANDQWPKANSQASGTTPSGPVPIPTPLAQCPMAPSQWPNGKCYLMDSLIHLTK